VPEARWPAPPALANLGFEQPPLSLYVHIPWCERKCPYCDFNSHEHFSTTLEQPYVAALLADLQQQIRGQSEPTITSIFIGGGTPSLFSAEAIGTLLGGIRSRVKVVPDAEITLECNPSSAEISRFQGYRRAGVNRLSLGVQSFHDGALTALGRIHSAEQSRRAVTAARDLFERFNIDLMHGLPGQDQQQALDDVSEAINQGADHISWYQLTIEPNTAFYSSPPTLPVEDTLATIQTEGEALLHTAGFHQYEVSAWARPGQASRHNMNYWTFGDYIGIGAGAHGKITEPNGTIVRTRRSRVPKDYMASIAEQIPPIKEAIPDHDVVAEFLLNTLRLQDGVPTNLLARRTGKPLTELEDVWSTLLQKGLVTPSDQRLSTTPLGYRFLNDVIGAFLDP